MDIRGISKPQHRYTWTFPICPHAVIIDLQVISALEHQLSATAEPVQGLLFGSVRPEATYIDAQQPVASFDPDEFRRVIERGRRAAVGYYRIREGRAFILTADEIRLAKDLHQPGSVALLVERRATGPAEGAFCFWRGESFVTNLPVP